MSTGTTSLGPMYPMIPHMTRCSLSPQPLTPNLQRLLLALLLLIDPPVDVPLLAGADGQRPLGHVFTDRRPAADVGPLPDTHRRHQLRVAADERPIFDDRRVFADAVVVARNG